MRVLPLFGERAGERGPNHRVRIFSAGPLSLTLSPAYRGEGIVVNARAAR
jgi:hypothetical protein